VMENKRNEPKTLEEAIEVIKQLTQIVDVLRKENEALKERLNINSKNSSLAPSQDIRKPKGRKKISKRKQGAQVGHQGNYRALLPEEKVNKVVHCKIPKKCPDCRHDILIKGIQRHQVFDIPPYTVEVTEYKKYRGACTGCFKKYEGEFPTGVTWRCLGERAHGMISLLTSKYRLSKRLAASFLKETHGLSISLGTVSNTESVVSQSLELAHEDIKEKLQSASLLHLDETGHKEKNKNGWAWLMGNEDYTLFCLRRSRGKKIAQELIGSYGDRIFVTDRYAAYDYLPDQNRQVCWAHLKRDFKKISERKGISSIIGTGLLKAYVQIFRLYKREPLKRRLEHKKTQQWFRRYQRRLLYLLELGSRCGDKRTQRTCENLLSIQGALWTFWSTNVPPTNNQAERQLRPLVISKKLTFGTQSHRGSRYIERIFTILMSSIQQKQPVLNFLTNSVHALFSNSQPTLLG
jgi:transposase